MDVNQAKTLVASLFDGEKRYPCTIKFWDDTELSFGGSEPAFKLKFNTPESFEALLTDMSLGFGEAYTKGDIEVEGDISRLLEWAYKSDLQSRLSMGQKARLCWINFKKKATVKQTKKDVQAHYDRGNDFYKLWLDKRMVYSCAYFKKPDDSLEKAQLQKINHTLRKMRIKKGQRLLDIGCGWGALLIEAVRNYGVKAVGLTLSERQFELGNKRIKDAGLSDMAEIRLEDYRELPESEDKAYDRVVSIGMFEHVGKENIPVFFKKMGRLLRPKGILLLHTIGRLKPEAMDPWLSKYIFPGTYVPALGEIFDTAEKCGFDFADLEDLRQHYDRTLGEWAKRFEANIDQIREMMGDEFVRMWRLYLYGTQMSFRHNPLHVFQLLYSLGRRNDWPLVRI